MTTKPKRALIQIAGIEVEVFQIPNGEYVMSQTQVAKAIGVSSSSIFDFLRSEAVNALPDNGSKFSVMAVEGSNKPINIIPIDIVTDYWFEQAFKGNIKAKALVKACTHEALQRRCDTAFGQAKSEQQYEQQSAVNRDSWEQSREFCRSIHSSFTNSCIRWKFNAAMAHNAITLGVCGKTASELRELELIDGTSDIGLNHIADIELLVKIAKVKLHFSRYRKGGISERVERALSQVAK